MDGSATTRLESRQSQFVQRHARSRDGCLTCKRRKVKCDESRPRCAHCERLNLECRWIPPSSSFGSAFYHRRQASRGHTPQRTPVASDGLRTPTSTAAALGPARHSVTQIFDYASFMWDNGDVWQQVNGGDLGSQVVFEPTVMGAEYQAPPDVAPAIDGSVVGSSLHGSEPSTSLSETGLPSDPSFAVNQPPVENHRLMDYFIHAVTPPILAEVETQKQWLAMRQVLIKMANASRMVRWAILAFSNQLLCRRDGVWMTSEQNHYDNAAAEVAMTGEDGKEDLESWTQHTVHRENILATLFFLSYVDILEGRIEAAHEHLKRAYVVFQHSQKDSFTATEKQLLLWIRLLDARAVSAGGDGFFLSKDDEDMLVQTSPASLGGGGGGGGGEGSEDDPAEGDMEDVLFQVLYQPGILFFQKVQSFMGRISKIDPWHRSRGTVEDEIEVMNAGSAIAADLRALYEQRPLLMDHAAGGRLTAPYVSAHLAFVVTRAFRTYLSNYYASKIHLHRVAFKVFPLTKEAGEAVGQIRRLSRLIAEGLDADDCQPVNMLWPLLMLGSEEQDAGERAWIRAQILRMERVAGNARITAQVLEEVQARQDAGKARVDIRSVMHSIFNACFAIV